jgi:hypothetical protein
MDCAFDKMDLVGSRSDLIAEQAFPCLDLKFPTMPRTAEKTTDRIPVIPLNLNTFPPLSQQQSSSGNLSNGKDFIHCGNHLQANPA